MNKSLLIGAAIALLVSTSVSHAGGTVNLCAGKEGGGYDTLMRAVGQELTKNGITVNIINKDGSEGILNALESGQCDYGPAQADVNFKIGKDDQAFQAAVRPAAVLYNEVPQLICSKASGIDELSDLTDKNTVIVDTIGSGSAITWDNFVYIENTLGNKSSWAKAKTNYTPLDEAEAAISVGEADCMFGVAGLPASWAQTGINDGMTLAWVYDKNIQNLEFPKGTPLYNYVRIPSGKYPSKFDTYRIPAVLFKSAASKVDPQTAKLVLRIAPALGKRKDTTQ
jgi:TRAP-type uncharacterized transport system substrate-binding protein